MKDLISRQAAIDVLDGGAELLKRVLDDTDIVGREREKFAWGLGLLESFIEDMKELPSAQPERKTGEWTFLETNGFKCSECKRYLNIACGDVKMNFCPNCGADMRGEADE